MKYFFATIALLLSISCAGGGKYLSGSGLDQSNYRKGHYIFNSNGLILSAIIRSNGIMGSFRYEIMIINTGNVPIQLHYLRDFLYLVYKGKIHQLKLMTPPAAFPTVINPDSFAKLSYIIEKRFNNTINDITELQFSILDKRYTLQKNSSALWE